MNCNNPCNKKQSSLSKFPLFHCPFPNASQFPFAFLFFLFLSCHLPFSSFCQVYMEMWRVSIWFLYLKCLWCLLWMNLPGTSWSKLVSRSAKYSLVRVYVEENDSTVRFPVAISRILFSWKSWLDCTCPSDLYSPLLPEGLRTTAFTILLQLVFICVYQKVTCHVSQEMGPPFGFKNWTALSNSFQLHHQWITENYACAHANARMHIIIGAANYISVRKLSCHNRLELPYMEYFGHKKKNYLNLSGNRKNVIPICLSSMFMMGMYFFVYLVYCT